MGRGGEVVASLRSWALDREHGPCTPQPRGKDTSEFPASSPVYCSQPWPCVQIEPQKSRDQPWPHPYGCRWDGGACPGILLLFIQQGAMSSRCAASRSTRRKRNNCSWGPGIKYTPSKASPSHSCPCLFGHHLCQAYLLFLKTLRPGE